jgi:hypothetical protein
VSRSNRSVSFFAAIALLAVGFAGCENAGHDQVLSVDATGVVGGMIVFDLDGGGEVDPDDAPVSGVAIRLIVRDTDDTVGTATSGADGRFNLPRVPVGQYDVAVDEGTVGDSAVIIGIDTTRIVVARGDTTMVTVTVSYPSATVAEARALPVGRKVFVEGITLNGWATFGDSTVHLTAGTVAIRGTRVRQSDVIPGDEARFLGVREVRNGQPTLGDVQVFRLGSVGAPPPEPVTTAVAAVADGGALDADLVQVDATIADTATVGQDFRLTVDDGTGPLEVLLDGDAPFLDLTSFVPGALLEATGLLVPTGSGTWRLKPRGDGDLDVS